LSSFSYAIKEKTTEYVISVEASPTN
jgi:hypothetical protein